MELRTPSMLQSQAMHTITTMHSLIHTTHMFSIYPIEHSDLQLPQPSDRIAHHDDWHKVTFGWILGKNLAFQMTRCKAHVGYKWL